jgi:hypothetical protein
LDLVADRSIRIGDPRLEHHALPWHDPLGGGKDLDHGRVVSPFNLGWYGFRWRYYARLPGCDLHPWFRRRSRAAAPVGGTGQANLLSYADLQLFAPFPHGSVDPSEGNV